MTTARALSRHRKELYSGRYIDYADPQPEQISLDDIAHALSNICRYGGHTPIFYSVAEHAILVAGLLQEQGYVPKIVLAGLHHDDHEAYLGDLPTPLKNALGEVYEAMRVRIDAAIATELDLDLPTLDHPAIHWADAVALRMEAHLLMPSKGRHAEWAPAWEKWGLHAAPTDRIGGWEPGMTPEDAEAAYLGIHVALSTGRGTP